MSGIASKASKSKSDMPKTFVDLENMNRRQLREIHSKGVCPSQSELQGPAEGRILHPKHVESLRLWRGKVFDSDGGVNRLGVGPFEFRRYRFKTRIQKSAFSDREILFLDHDQPGNPFWVRIFHDELVEMCPGFYLACSHVRIRGQLRYMSYFAFDFRALKNS